MAPPRLPGYQVANILGVREHFPWLAKSSLWDQDSMRKPIFHLTLTISDLNSSKDAPNYVGHRSGTPRPPAFAFCTFFNEIHPKILTGAPEMALQPMFFDSTNIHFVDRQDKVMDCNIPVT